MNAVEIEEAVSALASQPFDAAEFPFSFLAAFGNKETTIKRLRTASANASDVAGGVLQKSNIHIATCAEGKVGETLVALRTSPKTASNKAKFILATDGVSFEAEDLASGETVVCDYSKFPDHFGLFLPLAGITTVKQIRESSFDIRATGRLNKLYVELLKDNPEWSTAARRPDMNHFMARLIFCFFAEETDIFNGEGVFTSTIDQMSDRDSSNTHEVIGTLFRAMNTKIADRATANLPRWANGFPYVNGGLFSGSTEVPRFSKIARSYLLHIGGLNWKLINPDIFGSMIQAVADDDERGALGMHYTSVPNILKVLNPLFLDDLREKLADAGDNARKLLNLRNRMSKIRVFDPACGSGNFLVIAYKQMREIEADINKRRGEPDRRTEIPLTNFRGIELRDFPAEIARLALIIAEYQCDVLYRGQKEALAEFLPLDAENWIVCGNALGLDWLSVCPPNGKNVQIRVDDLFDVTGHRPDVDFKNNGGETYVCGNPPYIGGKKLSIQQKDDMVACGLEGQMQLDYVCCWLAKFSQYHKFESEATAAFVCTSSICQGEQVGVLWPSLHDKGLEIRFCHTPFKWQNNASNNAGVMCCVVGLGAAGGRDKTIYSDGVATKVSNISPYLVEGRDIYITSVSAPLNGLPAMCMGSNPVDGTHLVLTAPEKQNLVSEHLDAEKFVRRYLGGNDVLRGTFRYCLWIDEQSASEALRFPPIQEKVRRCREYRLGAGRDASKVANIPFRFCYRTHQEKNFIAIPKTSSSARDYLPVDVFKAGPVVNVDAFAVYGAELHVFSLLSSRMHAVWLSTSSGRLGDGIRYSVKLSYNNFPLPLITEKNRRDLSTCAEEVLLAREAHFPATLAELYDPDAMPADLRAAHDRNDEVLERIYIGRRFRNDTERLEKLFELYSKFTAEKAPKKQTRKGTA